ncbi:MAG: TIM barrel protein [Candidatus Thermoplasmatota archaeon]|nr:TIM barrel protein [Candidatus Thermoplasmatota archaeon]
MIRFGIAGIPLSCKGRTLVEGIKDTANLGKRETGKGLEIMEVEILRPGEWHIDTEEVKKAAKKDKVTLFVHAPYYTSLGLSKREAERSIEVIQSSAVFAKALNAELLIVHLGMYGRDKKECLDRATKSIRTLKNFARSKCKGLKIAIETSGKQALIGSLEEVIEICRKVRGIVPLINFAHIHARGNGCLREKEDFADIFEKLSPLRQRKYFSHFSGVTYEDGEELDLVPLKKSDLKFEPLAELLIEKKYDISIISSSPLLEHDAINMKIILERVKEKLKKKRKPKPRIKVKLKKRLKKKKR